MPKALLIDDEFPARAALRGLLRAHPEITLAGEADSIAAARVALARSDYDLVFLDIQLRGGTGFDLVPEVRAEARIVFVTAYDQYAVRAFEVNALDYLIKPVPSQRLAEALRRLGPAPGPGAESPTAVEREPTPLSLAPGDLVHLKIGNGTTRFVALADIVAIESAENYSAVHLAGGTRFLVRRTLKTWEDTLPATHFGRVHRTTIINLERYRGADQQTDETSLLHLDGLATPVRASFRYLPDLWARLAALGRKM